MQPSPTPSWRRPAEGRRGHRITASRLPKHRVGGGGPIDARVSEMRKPLSYQKLFSAPTPTGLWRVTKEVMLNGLGTLKDEGRPFVTLQRRSATSKKAWRLEGPNFPRQPRRHDCYFPLAKACRRLWPVGRAHRSATPKTWSSTP